MKLIILLIGVSFLFLSFSISVDTVIRLNDTQNHDAMVDTSFRLILTEDEPIKKIGPPISINDYALGSNSSSLQNVNPKLAAIVSACFILFIAYIVFRVRRSLRTDKKQLHEE